GGEVDQARSRQVRLEGRARAPAVALGERGVQGAEVAGVTTTLGALPRALVSWLVAGWAAFALLPWNAIGGQGFLASGWIGIYPLARLLLRAFVDRDGNASWTAFTARLLSSRVWGVGGVVWNTL